MFECLAKEAEELLRNPVKLGSARALEVYTRMNALFEECRLSGKQLGKKAAMGLHHWDERGLPFICRMAENEPDLNRFISVSGDHQDDQPCSGVTCCLAPEGRCSQKYASLHHPYIPNAGWLSLL